MSQVVLKALSLRNFGPIVEDSLELERFTYLVGRNNAGKSHYLKAIELLLAPKNPSSEEISKILNNKEKEAIIEGTFTGVKAFTALVTKSNHKQAIEDAIVDDSLKVTRRLTSTGPDECVFGVYNASGEIENPTGFTGNLLKVLPEVIAIEATADTIDEMKTKGNTAIAKLKREVLGAFLENLKEKAKEAFATVDEFLHSMEKEKRSADLTTFENNLKEELVGEFFDVVPTVEFELPDEDVITQGMKIFLNDGYRSEVEQKGHGLQRATLLALLRLLAKQGRRYQDKPAPIFLIGEIETFLHPYAQRQLADALTKLVDRYQIITTTHSPFIINPRNIGGYRRVVKGATGTKTIIPDWKEIEIEEVKRHLDWRSNLEGLFADRVILIEGPHDEIFYEKLTSLLGIEHPARKFTLFVKAHGKKNLRLLKRFYVRMGFDDVAIISDLDYLYCNDARYLFSELGLDPKIIDSLRTHIGWTEENDPGLAHVLNELGSRGMPSGMDNLMKDLRAHRIFILWHGAPENYVKNRGAGKNACNNLKSIEDLEEIDYLRELMREVVNPDSPQPTGRPAVLLRPIPREAG